MPVPPSGVERRYTAELLGAMRRLEELVLQKLRPLLRGVAEESQSDGLRRDADDEESRLEAALNSAAQAWSREFTGSKLESLAFKAGEAASQHQKRQWVRQVKAVIGIEPDTVEAWAPSALESFSRENASLIGTLSEETVEDVRTTVLEAVRKGARHETVSKLLTERMGVSKSRAKLIARDQIGKVTATFEKERQVRSGVTQYIWRTVRDNRVRERHEELQGKTFSWDDPPVVDPKTGRKAHPGEDFQCRCWAEPVLDKKEEKLPATEFRLPAPAVSLAARPSGAKSSRQQQLKNKPEKRTVFPKTTIPMNERQQVADQNARWLVKSKEARETASFEERRDWLLWEWVHGSTRETSVLMKVAAKAEFGLTGAVYTRGRKRQFFSADVTRVQQDLRRISEESASALKQQGVVMVTLYRGFAGETWEADVLESWTSDRRIAEQFAALRASESGMPGFVEKREFSVEKVLACNTSPGWVAGAFGQQHEFIVMF